MHNDRLTYDNFICDIEFVLPIYEYIVTNEILCNRVSDYRGMGTHFQQPLTLIVSYFLFCLFLKLSDKH